MQNQETQAIMDSDRPEVVVLKLYDIGIESCIKRDKIQVEKVLRTLTNSLNFEYTEIANSFYELYQYALKVLKEENFDDILLIMKDLRAAWENVVNAKQGDLATN